MEVGNHSYPHSSGLGWGGPRLHFQKLGLRGRQNGCTEYTAKLRTKSMGQRRHQNPRQICKWIWNPRDLIKHGKETGKNTLWMPTSGALKWGNSSKRLKQNLLLNLSLCYALSTLLGTLHMALRFIIIQTLPNACLRLVLLKRNQSLDRFHDT